jgi:orotidine-5'-phosphate decarboxylase
VNRIIILALDTTNLEEAINITKKVKDKIFTVKLGLEFFNAHGKAGVKKFNEIGITNLLLDLKLKDVPETVYKAIKALDDIKFGYITIHGQGGKEMIEKAKKAVSEIKSRPKIMMVTILTALNDSDLKDIGNDNTVNEQVEKLATLAKETSVGIVCSGREAKNVRKIIGADLLIFTPGIRMNKDNKDDQQRVCTPMESIKNGSDKIIMGRSLIKGNIEENLNQVAASIKI